MSLFSVMPQPSFEMVHITAKQARRWEYFVLEGMEIAFKFEWSTGHPLQLKLISQESLNCFLTSQRSNVDVWAYFVGVEKIQGSIVPPTMGGWVLLLEAVPGLAMRETISVSASSVVQPINK